MVVLFILFLIQFSVACACLAMNSSQQRALTETGWSHADEELKSEVQKWFGCCGYNLDTLGNNDTMHHPSCLSVSKILKHSCLDWTDFYTSKSTRNRPLNAFSNQTLTSWLGYVDPPNLRFLSLAFLARDVCHIQFFTFSQRRGCSISVSLDNSMLLTWDEGIWLLLWS